MKIFKKNKFLPLIAVFILLFSCEIEDSKNLNGPTTDSVTSDISRAELIQAVSGVLADMRTVLGTQVDAMSVAGREYWRFQSSDPAWVADLLTGTLDNNAFYTTNSYAARFANIKNVNLILEGLDNTTSDLTEQEVNGAKGFINTIKAHEYLMLLNHQFENGIRLEVNDPLNLGPFVSYDEGLEFVTELLSEARLQLANAGSSFAFPVPSGFNGLKADIEEPLMTEEFLNFTNGLAARVEAYRGNYENVLSLLNDSFLDTTGDLNAGVYFTFSLTGADIANPLFFALNSTIANARIAHPSFIDDAETGDERLEKVVLRNSPLGDEGLLGNYDVFVYESNIAPVPVMKNAELILLLAEAQHLTNPAASVDAINVIRNAAGLANYNGGTSPEELVSEILNQRRYSLYGEGHRWIDMRRFDRLDELPIDRTGDNVFPQFPIPANENQG